MWLKVYIKKFEWLDDGNQTVAKFCSGRIRLGVAAWATWDGEMTCLFKRVP